MCFSIRSCYFLVPCSVLGSMQVCIWFAGLRGACAFAISLKSPTGSADGFFVAATLFIVFTSFAGVFSFSQLFYLAADRSILHDKTCISRSCPLREHAFARSMVTLLTVSCILQSCVNSHRLITTVFGGGLTEGVVQALRMRGLDLEEDANNRRVRLGPFPLVLSSGSWTSCVSLLSVNPL